MDVLILTVKICLRPCSDGVGRHSMVKWRMNRGVTGLRPPPGGAHAAAMVISCRKGESDSVKAGPTDKIDTRISVLWLYATHSSFRLHSFLIHNYNYIKHYCDVSVHRSKVKVMVTSQNTILAPWTQCLKNISLIVSSKMLRQLKLNDWLMDNPKTI